jgi:hypothetical protein
MIGRILIVSLLAPATLAAPLFASQASDAEKERFLLEGVIVATEDPPGGSSRSVRAHLRLDGVEHDAMVHTLDEWKASFRLVDRTELDFRDSYKNNIAAYRLDRVLGLGMVPVTVLRSHKGEPASFMWWVDVKMYETDRLKRNIPPPDPGAWMRQIYTIRIFDQLIHNYDRNTGNLAIDTQWQLWMIDHTRAFKVFSELLDPEQLGNRCERDMLAALRRLDEPSLREMMMDVLNPDQIQGLLGRRDAIVAHFDDLIAEKGEILVLFDLPPRDDSRTH